MDLSGNPEAAPELVAVGWWEDHGGHYQIVHHLGYQRTKAQIAQQSLANRGNANKRWQPKQPKNANRNANRNAKRTGQDRPGEQERGTSLDGEDRSAEYLEAWGSES